MSNARRLLDDIQRKLVEEDEATRLVPEATAPLGHRRLCVGMATFDDFDGVWFTLEALTLYHPEVADDVSFLVVDNHPEAPMAADLKSLDQKMRSLRYVPFKGYRSTAARDLIFREADADIVCCVDSHVLLKPGALAAVVDYFDRHPDSRDLLQGPLLADDLSQVVGTHFEPEWGGGMYGRWAVDPRLDGATEPFEIPMQGLGFFACRRAAWPGLNPRFRGFGGEEGYLHEKIRQGGGRVLCHPDLGWVHRFTRPSGPPYRPTWEDRVRNYRFGWAEIGWDVTPMEEHFRDHLGDTAGADTQVILDQTARQMASPFSYFDAVFRFDVEGEREAADDARRKLLALDIGWRTEPWPVVAVPDDLPRESAIAWRNLVEAADHRGYRHVLGFEGEVPALVPGGTAFDQVVDRLEGSAWDVCVLESGGNRDGTARPRRSLALHRRAFARILDDLPTDDPGMDEWIDRHGTLEGYLQGRSDDGSLVVVDGTGALESGAEQLVVSGD